MSEQSEDKDFEEYLQRDSSVSKHYRALENVEPSANLDASIVARAEQEVRAAQVQRARRWKRWSVPVALAASTVLAISIMLESGVRHNATTSSVGTETYTKQEASETEAHSSNEIPAADQVAAEAPRAPEERETLVHIDTTPGAPAPGSEVMLDKDASTLEPSLAKKAENRAEQASLAAEARVETQDNYAAASSDGPASSEPTPDTSIRSVAPPPTAITTTAASRRSVPLPASAEAEELSLARNPEEWLEHIRELRETGKQQEADREWTRFEAAFPTYEVSRDDVARPKNEFTE